MAEAYYEDAHIKIYNKDCRDMSEVADNSVDLVLTDPPYDILAGDLRAVWAEVAKKLRHRGNLIWTFNTCRLQIIGQTLIPELTEIRTAVWHKPFCPSPWRFGWSWHWEPIIWWMKGNDRVGISKYKFKESDVIPVDVIRPTDMERLNHHDQKPDALWSKLIGWFSEPNDLILDPFLGSGTATFCAKKLNRRCIGYEISQEYCDLAIKRNRQQVMELS